MITPRHPQGASSPDEDPTGVRALLSALPEPGPMPPELVARITASLEREHQARVEAGAVPPEGVTPLIRRPSRSGWFGRPSRLRQVVALGSAAAAVAAVAAVGTVVVLDQRPGVPAAAKVAPADQHAAGGNGGVGEKPGAVGPLPGTDVPVNFEASGTPYTSAGFAQQAATMQATNHTPLRQDALQRPEVKKLGPPMNLGQCIKTLGAGLRSQPDRVWVDLGTYDGSPAVIIVVTAGGKSQAWAVGRTCRAGQPSVIAGPTTVA